jgi:hypothetical protein
VIFAFWIPKNLFLFSLLAIAIQHRSIIDRQYLLIDHHQCSKREMAVKKNLTTFAKAIQAVARPAVAILVWFLPLAISYCRFLHTTWKKIPYDASTFLVGVVFCFFGGLYPTLFAALQAAKHSGISVSRLKDK